STSHSLSLAFRLISPSSRSSLFFFHTATAPTPISTLSLHDALPIFQVSVVVVIAPRHRGLLDAIQRGADVAEGGVRPAAVAVQRSEEHTSELQSPDHLVCRLLLEKKKKKTIIK